MNLRWLERERMYERSASLTEMRVVHRLEKLVEKPFVNQQAFTVACFVHDDESQENKTSQNFLTKHL